MLIVEGEKAADAGNKLFKGEMICLSWLGGTGSVSKVDWSPLFGRDVVIWPDNDSPGYKAAGQIEKSLRKVGVKSLKVVSREVLSELPKKWDIADSLPTGKEKSFLKDCILRSESKSLGIDRLLSLIEKGKEQDSSELLRLNEISWRVDDRLRAGLEGKYGSKTWEIENKIFQEVSRIAGCKDDLGRIADNIGVKEAQKLGVIFQGQLHLARTGELPSNTDAEKFRRAVLTCSGVVDKKTENGNLPSQAALDAFTTHIVESGVEDKKVLEHHVSKQFPRVSEEVDRVLQRVQELNQQARISREIEV